MDALNDSKNRFPFNIRYMIAKTSKYGIYGKEELYCPSHTKYNEFYSMYFMVTSKYQICSVDITIMRPFSLYYITDSCEVFSHLQVSVDQQVIVGFSY